MAWLLSDVTHCRQGWPLWYITIKCPHQRDLSWKLLDWIFHLNILCKHSILPLQTFQERAPKHTLWSSWKRITAVRFIMFFVKFRSLHQLTSSVSPVHQYAMPEPGQMLTLEMMNLYHLDAWLIRPATQAKGCRLPAWESPMSTRWLQSVDWVDWHLAGFNPQNWSKDYQRNIFSYRHPTKQTKMGAECSVFTPCWLFVSSRPPGARLFNGGVVSHKATDTSVVHLPLVLGIETSFVGWSWRISAKNDDKKVW